MSTLPSRIIGFAADVAAWLDQHGGVVAFLGLVVAAAVAWYVYRDNVRSRREGVLDALTQELGMHQWWINNEYPGNARRWWEESDSRLLGTVIFRLSSNAVDTAIANGASLFLERRLLPALVAYRQMLGQFNQLIDQAIALQADPQLWSRFPGRHRMKRLRRLVTTVHEGGIGRAGSGGAYDYFHQVNAALQHERQMRLRVAIWLVVGLRLSTGTRQATMNHRGLPGRTPEPPEQRHRRSKQ